MAKGKRRQAQPMINPDKAQLGELHGRIDQLEAEIEGLRETVNTLRHQIVYGLEPAFEALVSKWTVATGDGWLLVNAGGSPASVPAHAGVSFVKTENGRDFFTVLEGVLKGQSCDTKTGFLAATNPHLPAARVVCELTTPVEIDGQKFDRSVTVFYRSTPGGSEKKEGPFPAKVDPQNPLPKGTYPLEIQDFPHASNPSYGEFRTVWFRIGRSGDKYLHVGRVSAGCVTCAAQGDNWARVYGRLSVARLDEHTVGTLEMK
jgi:hypothetical protein